MHFIPNLHSSYYPIYNYSVTAIPPAGVYNFVMGINKVGMSLGIVLASIFHCSCSFNHKLFPPSRSFCSTELRILFAKLRDCTSSELDGSFILLFYRQLLVLVRNYFIFNRLVVISDRKIEWQ